MIVSVPVVIPVTMPPLVMLAVVLLQLHVPPVIVSDMVAELPVQILEGPVIVPVGGVVLIVMICVAVAVPHALVTE
jgi:hypothetical protein